MNRYLVKSTNLRSVGYDQATKTLEVEFQNGAVHRYNEVPESHHKALVAAPSPGSYFHKHIRTRFKSSPVE